MTSRDGILILLGMPQSGASFLAETVAALGMTLPDDAAATAPFEPPAVQRLNDALLTRKGAWWGRIGPLEIAPDADAMHEALTDAFGPAARIAVKDPRITLLLPAWRAALEPAARLGALIALRHPGEVATSLGRRNGIGPDAAFLMWVHYLLTALEGTEGLARALILFPDWIDDPDATLTRIAAVSDLPVPEDAARRIAALFRPDAVHGGQELTATDPETDLLAGDLFALAARHARDGSVPDRAELAPFRARFAALAQAPRDAEAMAGLRILDLQGQLDDATARAARLAEEARAQSQANAALRDEIAALRAEGGQPAPAAPTPASASDPDPAPDPGNADRRPSPRPAPPGRLRHALHWIFGGPARRTPSPPPPDRTGTRPDPGSAAAPAAGPPDIFILAAQAWAGWPGRPQYLAAEWAARGHRVFFVEPVMGDGLAQQVAPRIHRLRPPLGGLQVGDDSAPPPSPAMQRAWVDHFHAFADRQGVTPRAHVLIAHPAWWPLARHLSPQFQLTLDCGDTVEQAAPNPSAPNPSALRLQQQMMADADRLIVPTQAQYDRFSGHRPARLIRNGADTAHVTAASGAAFELDPRRAGAIRIGYAGEVSDAIDADLLTGIARANPDFDIHLCSPAPLPMPSPLPGDLPNLRLHGDIPHAGLPDFLAAMDVMILPFRPDTRPWSSDPIAFYDAAAAGRPVVATGMPELARLGDLVATASGAAPFAAAIRAAAAAAQNPMTAARLRAFALENAWSYRASALLEEMERAPLLSVVIPTSGPAAATLAALHMLTGRGEVYPALEILLVDAGADPAAQEELRTAIDADTRIRPVACAQGEDAVRAGIAAARGDFILPLDPLARVAAGALAAMVRHLQRNPRLDRIAALTNAPGTGATPDDPTAIDRTARALVTGHRGQWTPAATGPHPYVMFRRADPDPPQGPADGPANGAVAEDAYIHRAAPASGDPGGGPGTARDRPRASLPDSPR